jgi:hypothetical protein
VKFTGHSHKGRFHTPLARGFVCVLLIGLIYSVTFGFEHSHADESSGTQKNIAASTAGQDFFSSETTLYSQFHGHSCLVCLLRQHLLDCCVHSSNFVVSPSELVTSTSDLTVSFHAFPITTKHIIRLSGRAPPRN